MAHMFLQAYQAAIREAEHWARSSRLVGFREMGDLGFRVWGLGQKGCRVKDSR